MKIIRIYSLNRFPLQCTAVLLIIIFIILYITSIVLIYPVSLYLLTAIIQTPFLPPLPLVARDMIYLIWCLLFDISIHFKMYCFWRIYLLSIAFYIGRFSHLCFSQFSFSFKNSFPFFPYPHFSVCRAVEQSCFAMLIFW